MNRVRATTPCARCNAANSEHGTTGSCPDGNGTFERRAGWRPATSFGAVEISYLAEVLVAVEQRKPLSQLQKRPELRLLARKVHGLARGAVRAKQDKERAASRPKAPREAPNRRLNPDCVRAIRALRAQGTKAAVLAKAYGVTRRTIEKVVTREVWGHVE